MVSFDIVISLIIIIFSIKGIFKGAMKEIIGFIVLFLSIFIVPIFAENAGSFLSDKFDLKIASESLYFLGYFFLVVFLMFLGGIISIISWFFLTISGLSIIDRLAGFFIGGIKSVLIITIFLTVGSNIEMTKGYFKEKGKNSIYYQKFLSIGDKIMFNIEVIKNETIKNSKAIEKTASSLSNKVLDSKRLSNIKEDILNVDKRNNVINNINKKISDGLNLIDKKMSENK